MKTRMVSLALACLTACTVAPAHEGEIGNLGSMRIVYLDMDQNLGIDTHHLKSEIAAGVISPLAVSLVFIANHQLDKSGEASLVQAEQVIQALPFRDEMFVQARQAVQSSPWASHAAFDHVARNDDWDDDLDSAGQAMSDGGKDAALFISPAVYLDNTGQDLYVAFHVTVYNKVIGPSSDKPIVHRYASNEFRYSYHLKLHDPEPSFAQQKIDARLMANMSMPGAMPYWTAADGAQLRKDFEDALPKLASDLAGYLGAPMQVARR